MDNLDLFSQGIKFWHWLSFAVFLGIVEILVPGIFFIWLAAAAMMTGIVVFLTSPAWEIQLLLFSFLSVASLFLWHRIGRFKNIGDPTLNRRGEQMIDRHVTLVEPIVNGRGTVKINDSVWRVEGPDLPAGTRVKVTGVDGTLLKVRPD